MMQDQASDDVQHPVLSNSDAVLTSDDATALFSQIPWHAPALIAKGTPKRIGDLIYCEPAMDQVANAIRRVAPHDAPVFIQGESGTGKELVARAIYQLGPRAADPFVAVNCAALTPPLVESELFGHERGAFTGADRTRLGAFEEAGQGTLFLDEVGDLSLEVQAKLLRALENSEIRRVGAHGTRKVQCRVVTATHQKLCAQVAQGAFRNDLFHRLSVLPIQVPPLRDRKSDVATLSRHFLQQVGNGKTVVTPAALKKLEGHSFPGNVRELRNVLFRAVILSGQVVLDASDIVFQQLALTNVVEHTRIYLPGRTLAEIEAVAIHQAIQSHGSHSAAARALGISRSTLIARVKSRRGQA